MRAAIILASTALVFVTGCQRSPEIVTTSDGAVYFTTGGKLYHVHGNTMNAVLTPTVAPTHATSVKEFGDSIASMGISYQVKLKAFGPADVRYILTVQTLNDSAVFSGPRSCWRAWTQSGPYLGVELLDADGFRVGNIAVDRSTERVSQYNPRGAPKGFQVDGSLPLLTETILAQVSKSSPLWQTCSQL